MTRQPTTTLVLDLLADGKPRTVLEMAEALLVSDGAVQQAIIKVRARVHVESYYYGPRSRGLAKWQIGAGTDAKRRKPPTTSERNRANREYAAQMRRDAELALQRIPFRHWQDEALFGEYRT